MEFVRFHGYAYRVIFGGQKVVLCEGGHLQVGSALIAKDDAELARRVDRWLSQYEARVKANTKIRGRKR